MSGPAAARKATAGPDTVVVESGQTLYGSRWGSPASTAAVLRARAARFGLSLLPTSEADLAAACVGAHLWCGAYGTSSVENPSRWGFAAVHALSALLARAAGHGTRPQGQVDQWHRLLAEHAARAASTRPELIDRLHAHAVPALRWADELAGPAIGSPGVPATAAVSGQPMLPVVAMLAAYDLLAGGTDDRLAAAAHTLLDAADR